MAIPAVNPVSAPLPSIGVDHTHDQGNPRAHATAGKPRASQVTKLHKPRKQARIKGSAKARKTAKEQIASLLQTAIGAQIFTETKLNDARAKERDDERNRRVALLEGGRPGNLLVFHEQESDARRVYENRVRVEKKRPDTSSRQGARASASSSLERETARFRGKAKAAAAVLARLPIDVLERAANSPAERVSRLTGIEGVPAEILRRICAQALQTAIRPSLDLVYAVSAVQPDERLASTAFAKLVDFCADENDKRVHPSVTIHKGIERAPTLSLFAAACAVTSSAWPLGGGGAPAAVH